MTKRMRSAVWILAGLFFATAVASARDVDLVVCAPGFPGTTEQAAPTMNAFAEAAGSSEAWTAGALTATYHENLQRGLERLRQPSTSVAIVPLAFYLSYREEFDLRPVLEVETTSGRHERWSLVASSGRVAAAGDLAGWKLAARVGYSPAFVRRVVLASWGPVPADVEVGFVPRIVSALRRASRGEDVAVLLDRAEAESLDSLPLPGKMEVVARSAELPSSLLCVLGDRLSDPTVSSLRRTMLTLHETPAGQEALTGMRMVRFHEVDSAGLRSLESSFRDPSPAKP